MPGLRPELSVARDEFGAEGGDGCRIDTRFVAEPSRDVDMAQNAAQGRSDHQLTITIGSRRRAGSFRPGRCKGPTATQAPAVYRMGNDAGTRMFEPMWDPQGALFGVPVRMVPLAVGGVLIIVALLWIRRIVAGEPEVQSFWATAGPRRNWTLIAGVALAGLALALVLAVLAFRA
jgi:hypothetical protein